MRILLLSLLIKFKVGVDGEEASEPSKCSFDKVVVALIRRRRRKSVLKMMTTDPPFR